MLWKKKGFQPQSIRIRGYDEGQISMCTGLFFLLILSVLLAAHLQMEMFRSSSDYMEDALAASGLASALIDIREYGYSHVIRISDMEGAYSRYCECLKENLGLDASWEGGNGKLISGRVNVENYTVYNVKGDRVDICRMDQGRMETSSGKLGEVQAPNGQEVRHTGIYGEISYPVKGLFGLNVLARKGKLVDIVGQE